MRLDVRLGLLRGGLPLVHHVLRPQSACLYNLAHPTISLSLFTLNQQNPLKIPCKANFSCYRTSTPLRARRAPHTLISPILIVSTCCCALSNSNMFWTLLPRSTVRSNASHPLLPPTTPSYPPKGHMLHEPLFP